MFQVCNDIFHFLVTAANTLLGTFQDDLLQTVWKILCVHTRRYHLFLQMLDRNSYCSISVKRNPACDHLIKCDTKRIDVTLLITVSAAHLLR